MFRRSPDRLSLAPTSRASAFALALLASYCALEADNWNLYIYLAQFNIQKVCTLDYF